MATATNVRMSALQREPAEILVRLERVFEAANMLVKATGQLACRDGEWEFAGEIANTDSLADAIERGQELGDFALRLFAKPSMADLFLYFWSESDRWYSSMEIESTFTYY